MIATDSCQLVYRSCSISADQVEHLITNKSVVLWSGCWTWNNEVIPGMRKLVAAACGQVLIFIRETVRIRVASCYCTVEPLAQMTPTGDGWHRPVTGDSPVTDDTCHSQMSWHLPVTDVMPPLAVRCHDTNQSQMSWHWPVTDDSPVTDDYHQSQMTPTCHTWHPPVTDDTCQWQMTHQS